VTFRSQAKTTKTLKSNVAELKEKVKALDKFELIQKEYNEFRKSVPQTLSENKLIEMLSEIALKRGVRIVSFSPASKSSNNFLNLTNVEITVTSADYADLVHFINDIENSIYLIRIKKWSGVTKASDQPSRGYSWRLEPPIKSEDEYIETKVAIETVEFKYE
jgi:Tfp pilus assembly protein PilO